MTPAKSKFPPHIRTVLAIIWPICLGVFLAAVSGQILTIDNSAGLILSAVGLISIIMGLRWYTPPELGLRGGRPLMSGIGFAFLGWLGVLFARIIAVPIGSPASELGITFLYLLIIEAFCGQLWAFGLFFRSVAEWRHPISAAILSGVVFGLLAFFLFSELPIAQGRAYPVLGSAIYFIIWGIFYGFIRLRTGSLIGIVLIQAMQTLTAWYLIQPTTAGDVDIQISLPYLYGIAGIIFLIVTWRLWPKYVSDFRI